MTVALIIWAVLSLGIIGFLCWYCYNAIKKIQLMSHSVEVLDLGLQSFEKHLKWLYGLEMFYGDETLEQLILHSKDVTDSFAEFRKDYEIFNGEIDEKEFFEAEDNSAEEENPREDLLHQGS